jgi:hypothetical protein
VLQPGPDWQPGAAGSDGVVEAPGLELFDAVLGRPLDEAELRLLELLAGTEATTDAAGASAKPERAP